MRAAVYRRYGPPEVVRIEQPPTPVPKANEVLIRIRATTVSSGDCRVRSLRVPTGFGLFMRPVFGLFAPRQPILGSELAGEIAAVGDAVRTFQVGDAVFAFPGFSMGSHAEYRTMPEDGRVLGLPASLTFAQGAALSFGGTTALYFLRDVGRVQAGERVLIIGASGTVGSAAVQLAKHFGARVTAVTSGRNVELVRTLGAADVIDYTTAPDLHGGATYDIIFDTVGSTSYASSKHALRKGGRLLFAAASLPQLLAAPWQSLGGERRVRGGNTPERREDLAYLASLAEAGAYLPLIDRSYPLDEIAEAHAYVETGHKRGSVVITVPE